MLRGLIAGGQVTLGSPDHVALIAFALFNVSVPRTELPEDWRFEEGWVDADANKVEGELEFEVTQYDALRERGSFRLITTSSILSMLGSLKHLSKG